MRQIFFIHFLPLYLKKVYICANDEHTSGYAVIMHGFAVGWYYPGEEHSSHVLFDNSIIYNN